METTKNKVWHHYPALNIPSPVLALAVGEGGIWAGGAGGVAWRSAGDEWLPRISGLPLLSVTTLEYVDDLLIAGGTDGIAYSTDKGATWQQASLQEGIASIIALVASPNFASDKTLLAATLESGVLRSEDGGRHWSTTTFGLQNFEMSALAWGKGETVIAATIDGLYRSSNGGRAWRFVRDSVDLAIAALAYQADGTFLAATEGGQLLRSTDGGVRWQPYGTPPTGDTAPEGIECSALWVTPQGTLLLGSGNRGLLRSTDGGNHWDEVLSNAVLSFAANGQILYAGTAGGLYVSVDDGKTWRDLPHPPIHDLRRLLLRGEDVFLMGTHAGLLRYVEQGGWQEVPNQPYLLTGAAIGPDGALFIAGLDGLLRSEDNGESWQKVIDGEPGKVAHLSFRADGTGCAGSLDGAYLHRTSDGGKTWEPLKAPFGVLPLAALQVTEHDFIAASYDPRQFNVHVWRSRDRGENWTRELEAQTSWPLVSIYAEPLLMTMGDSVLLYAQEQWKQAMPEKGAGIRRVVGNGRDLFVLATTGILHSTDQGQNWEHDDAGVPTQEILDLALTERALYVLLTDGRVWSREL